jgi:hypothetical protein
VIANRYLTARLHFLTVRYAGNTLGWSSGNMLLGIDPLWPGISRSILSPSGASLSVQNKGGYL